MGGFGAWELSLHSGGLKPSVGSFLGRQLCHNARSGGVHLDEGREDVAELRAALRSRHVGDGQLLQGRQQDRGLVELRCAADHVDPDVLVAERQGLVARLEQLRDSIQEVRRGLGDLNPITIITAIPHCDAKAILAGDPLVRQGRDEGGEGSDGRHEMHLRYRTK